jgi:hypothetical protein
MREMIVAIGLVLALPSVARAAGSSQSINVQGILRNGSGDLQSMGVGMDVGLYDTATAATPFYLQHFATVPIDNGFFTIELSGPTLSFTGHPDAFIGILVNGDPAELPRQHLDAAPYALNAASADTLSPACNGCITNTMLGSSIDGSKVGKVATATSADSATNATQLGGVAAASYQRAITPASCPAGQVYSGITAAGAGTCTGLVSTATTASAVPFSGITGIPAACASGQFLVGYSGGNAVCAGLNFTTSGGNNGTATTVARGDHTHAGLGTGWVKIFDQAYNANGVITIPVTPVAGTFTVRVLFTGTVTPFSGPSEFLLRTSGGGTTNYNSFIVGEGAATYNTGPVQPGFIMGRTASTSSNEISFDYELTELPNLLGAVGHGQGATHVDGINQGTLLFRAGGNNEYFTNSTSISIQFWNTSNVNGRFTVLQLL